MAAAAAAAAAAAKAVLASGAGPVLKLVPDRLGLGATTGAHNPLDIIVIGSHNGLQLQHEAVRPSMVASPHKTTTCVF